MLLQQTNSTTAKRGCFVAVCLNCVIKVRICRFYPYFWLVDSQENHELVATRRHILRLKCTKFDFVWGSAPDPARGAYSAPPDPLAGFKWTYF